MASAIGRTRVDLKGGSGPFAAKHTGFGRRGGQKVRRARRPVQVLTLLATVAVAFASLTLTAGAADPAPPLADPLARRAFCERAQECRSREAWVSQCRYRL